MRAWCAIFAHHAHIVGLRLELTCRRTMTAVDMPLEVRPLTRHIGAELHGIDLANSFDERAFKALHAAFLEHHVVFVPGQYLGPSDLLGIASWFGGDPAQSAEPEGGGLPGCDR